MKIVLFGAGGMAGQGVLREEMAAAGRVGVRFQLSENAPSPIVRRGGCRRLLGRREIPCAEGVRSGFPSFASKGRNALSFPEEIVCPRNQQAAGKAAASSKAVIKCNSGGGGITAASAKNGH